MSSRTRDDVPTAALIALVVVAVAARAIGLNGGMWIDEIYSLVRSFRAPLATILTEYWGDNHHPLYAVLAHLSRGAFGESAWAVRLPAMLFGVATVPMLVALGRRIVGGREALLAASLLAVSYHHVWFSQNARGYSALAFFAVAATWALLRGLESGAARDFLLYGVLAGLGAYTHLTMVFVVVGHAVALTIHALLPPSPGASRPDARRTIRAGVIAFGTGGAVTVALYAPMLRGVLHYFANKPSSLKGVSTPGWAVVEAIRVLMLGLSGGIAVVGGIVLLVGAVVALSGTISLWRRHRLFVLLTFVPALVIIAGALAARGTMYPRFFFWMIGPAMLLLVRGGFAVTTWLGARMPWPEVTSERLGMAGVGAVVLLSAASLGFNYRYPKQDFEGAMRFVLAQRAAGDQVVSSGIPDDPYHTLYQQDWPIVSTRAELDAVRAKGGRTWVLWTFPRYLAASAPEVASVLDHECPEPRIFRGTVGGGDVLACALSPRE